MKMKKCMVCGTELPTKPLMVCKNMPSGAQNIPAADELDRDKGVDLCLYQCTGCGLVQLDCDPVPYYQDVIRAGGYSTTMRDLRRDQFTRLIGQCGLKGKKLVEVGCGQGEFLETLSEYPVQAFGIENKDELVRIAREKGLNVAKAFTEREDYIMPGGPFDAFLSFNFLEHQPDPNTMLRCIYHNLTDEGYGLITVPDFNYILENDGFYELVRDHIANYTEETLEHLVNRNGFVVIQRRRVNRDTIEFMVKKRPVVDVSGLQRNYEEMSEQMREYTQSRQASGKKVALWGASHQGFTVAAVAGVCQGVSYIIDSAPFKQGRFSPISHLPIVPPKHFFEDPVDCILIVAPGYTDEIAGLIRSEYGEDVEISVLRTSHIEKYAGGGYYFPESNEIWKIRIQRKNFRLMGAAYGTTAAA